MLRKHYLPLLLLDTIQYCNITVTASCLSAASTCTLSLYKGGLAPLIQTKGGYSPLYPLGSTACVFGKLTKMKCTNIYDHLIPLINLIVIIISRTVRLTHTSIFASHLAGKACQLGCPEIVLITCVCVCVYVCV